MRLAIAGMCLVAMACGPQPIVPADLRLGEDACEHCRMTLIAINTAAQIVAPGEEPVVFDDIGCMRDYLATRAVPNAARIFVADHRTGAWVDAATAVFTKAAIQTPMSSSLLAHADAGSRDADAAAAGGVPVVPATVLHRRKASP